MGVGCKPFGKTKSIFKKNENEEAKKMKAEKGKKADK